MDYFFIVLIIGLLILIHEFGHFISAKLMKIKIAAFSIGFGPKILKWKGAETEYRISLIPIGGYVLPAVEDENEFYAIPAYKRIIFSLGGPIANIAFPLILLAVITAINSSLSISNLFIKPVSQIYNYILTIINAILLLFTSPERLSGIVGIIAAGGQLIGSKVYNAINIFIILSLNLAVFNLLPIPALDGGKILLFFMEKIHPKFLKMHLPATIIGWIIILGLIIYATINDIGKLII